MMRMAFQLSGELGRQLSARSGMSYQDYLVLAELSGSKDGRMRSFELSAGLGWEKSRLSHHVARMAIRGFVERETAADDRRGAYVVITDQGRDAYRGAVPVHDDVVHQEFLKLVSRDELALIGDVASRVLAAMPAASDES
jgi:DNA-binding MarR family transcriptional regulator